MTFRWYRALFGIAVALAAVGSIALAATTPTMESTPVPKPPKPDFSSMSWACRNVELQLQKLTSSIGRHIYTGDNHGSHGLLDYCQIHFKGSIVVPVAFNNY